jgi:mono/diheme cytochrome c family protein
MRSYQQWLVTIAIVAVCGLAAAGPAQAQAAADLYKIKCQACHGPDGTGNTPMGKRLGTHNFHSPEVQKMTEAELIDVITHGKENMPAYGAGRLTADQIKGLAGYVHELGKRK